MNMAQPRLTYQNPVWIDWRANSISGEVLARAIQKTLHAFDLFRAILSPSHFIAKKVTDLVDVASSDRIFYDGHHEAKMCRSFGFLTKCHVDLYRLRGLGRPAKIIFSDNWNSSDTDVERIAEMIDRLADGGVLVLDFSCLNRNFDLLSLRYRAYLQAVLAKKISQRFSALGRIDNVEFETAGSNYGQALVFRKNKGS